MGRVPTIFDSTDFNPLIICDMCGMPRQRDAKFSCSMDMGDPPDKRERLDLILCQSCGDKVRDRILGVKKK